jgi:hypothetical protein
MEMTGACVQLKSGSSRFEQELAEETEEGE